MSLTPSRLAAVRALFEAALERTPETRAEFLLEAAPDDETLRAEVASLLDALDSTDDALDRPIAEHLGIAFAGAASRIGERVGPYELVRRIGVGGMGAVFEAVRVDDQFRKRVAVKLLRPGIQGEMAVRRFRHERQILAHLDHPNIAGLLDGGLTTDGLPYLVMEYVDGAPITIWCDERKLDIRARVALFRQVCEAVRFAHRNLIVHRDIKPGNVLVTGDGTVKLLDFGIAKLLRDPDDVDDLPATTGVTRAFTPEYASPEQILGLPVSTSSDVYALGVVLFELLGGQRPLRVDNMPLVAVERVICETLPPRPGSIVDLQAATDRGERSAARLRARLSGDLDAIALVALRKEPERRYSSVDLFDADLKRWLDGMPVTARPDSVGYRLGKFVRRRRLELASAAIVVLTLIGGVISTVVQAREAEAERARTAAINEFLLTMLGSADPGALGPDATVKSVLDSAAVKADALRDQPDLEAEVRMAIGQTYVGLGDYAAARTHFERALELRRADAPPRGDRLSALALSNVAGTFEFEGDYEGADTLHQAALAMLTATAPSDDPSLGTLLDNAARNKHNLGDLETAERLQRQAIAARERINGLDDPELVFSINNLGVLMGDRGNLQAADSLHRLAVATARRIHGERHPVVAGTLGNLAGLLERHGRLDEADSVVRIALDMRRELLGPEHPDYAWTLFNHAQILLKREQWAEAAARAREVLSLRGRTLTDAHPAVSTAMQSLGVALARLGEPTEGEPHLRESVELRRASLPQGHWLVASGEGVLGDNLTVQGRYAEAEALLLSSERAMLDQLGERSPQVRDARTRLVRLYDVWGRSAELTHWQTLLEATAPGS
jgi:serine/threonine-protein kinase